MSAESPYVPRLALERALAELSELIGKTPALAVLTGESGLGKTRLLHVLRERLSGAFACFYLPSGRLEESEFWSGVAEAIGLGTGDDDRSAVLGRAQTLCGDGSGLVLLLDDAEGLPAELVDDLIDACATPGLSIVLAHAGVGLEGEALPEPFRHVALGPPLTLTEARAYALARLRHLDRSGALAGHLSPGALAELYEASGGILGRLDALLDGWRLDQIAEAPATPPEALDRLRAAAREHRVMRDVPLPPAFVSLRERLERPHVRFALSALFVLMIGGFWYFALQRNGGGASVGVPVDRFEAPSAPTLAPLSEPDPDATSEPTMPAPEAPATEPASAAEAGRPLNEELRVSLRHLVGTLLDRA